MDVDVDTCTSRTRDTARGWTCEGEHETEEVKRNAIQRQEEMCGVDGTSEHVEESRRLSHLRPTGVYKKRTVGEGNIERDNGRELF